jgi:hypothetical protein
VKPKYLLHGTGDLVNARRILNSMYRPGTDLNDVNVVRDWDLVPICSTHLTRDGRWFLLAEPTATNGAGLWFDRQPLRLDQDTDVPGTLGTAYVGWMRFSMGFSDPAATTFGSL